MVFYHGTNEEAWNQIQKDGELFGYDRILTNDRSKVLHEHRVTYLATDMEDAEKYGDVVLLVWYEPNDTDNNYYDKDVWQLRVYVPIPLSKIIRIR